MIFNFQKFMPRDGSDAERVTSLRVLSIHFITIVAALHACSWLVAWTFQTPRADEWPLFNIDLLLAAGVTCIYRPAGVFALVLAWGAEFIRAAAKNYHFMSATDFVDAARFVDMLNLQSFVSASLFAIVAGFFSCVWVVLHLTRRSRRLALPLLAAALLAIACDMANGSFHIFGIDKDSRIVSMNFSGSPSWNMWRSERQKLVAANTLSPMPNPITFHTLRDWQNGHIGKTSMLVLVESMGMPRDPALLNWLRERLATQRLMARWTIRQGEEPFLGTTTSGELRTLCGLQGHYSRLDEEHATGCLPRRLVAQSVTSVGIHGFGLRMFDRNDWWPKIGLKPWRWQTGVTTDSPMNCNRAFPGVCDSTVIDQAITQAQQPRRFIYALTLDTHLPLDLRQAQPLPEDLRAACAESSTPAESCQLVRKLGDVLARIESRLSASVATPFIMVVGDHAPPFAESANRAAFAADRVPFFEIKPR